MSVQLQNNIATAWSKYTKSAQHQNNLDGARAKMTAAKPVFDKAKTEYEAIKAKFDKASPAKKKSLQGELDAASAKFEKAKDLFWGAEGDVQRLTKQAIGPQSETFAAMRDANSTARAEKAPLPFPAIDGFSSMEEARTLDPATYRAALGGEPTGKPGKIDVSGRANVIKLAAAGAGNDGPRVLAEQLRGLDPAAQQQVLQSAKADIEKISARVAKHGFSDDVKQFGEVVKNLDPSLRGQVVKSLAEKIQVSEKEAFHAGRGESLGFPKGMKLALAKGDATELLTPLLLELKSAGKMEAAKAIATEAGNGIAALRSDFAQKKAVVDDVQGDIARMVYGFKGSLDETQLKAGIDAIKSRHTKEFANLEESVRDALTVAKTLDSLPAEFKDLAKQGDKLRNDLPKILSTNAGQAELKQWTKQQALGNPSLLDNINAWASNGKFAANLKTDLSKLVTNSAATIALEGGSITKGTVLDFLKKNEKLLGLEGDKAKAVAGAINKWDPDVVATQDELKKALKDLPADASTGLSVLNLALAAPGLAQGWANFGEAETADRLKTLVGTGSFAADFVSVLSKAERFKGFAPGAAAAGKFFGAAASVLDGYSAVKNLAQGNYGDAAADGMSAAGGLMMLGGPGGMAVGGALVLGSFIVRSVWGKDPAAEAEKADEGDAQAFLQAGGMSEKVATGLSDLLQSNRRNVGTFITQMAGEYGMKPSEFVKHLDKLQPGELKQLVAMIKDMPADADWNYKKGKGDVTDRSEVRDNMMGIYFGPKSLETAKKWLEDKKFAPGQR